MTLATGSRIGPYELVARLGRGGMGDVFEAYDSRLDRRVAIKIVRPDAFAGTDGRERVLREARAAARVSHPGVAGVFDVLEHEGQLAIVMEFVQGETLSKVVGRGPLPPGEVTRLGIALAEAADAAHARGVVHRDLKPSNVVLCPTGGVKILDFGIAKLRPAAPLDDTTRPGTPTPEPIDGTRTTGFVGTPRYAAPEQLAGGSVDARADVFAIGSILFELAIGRPAFGGDDALAVALEIVRGATPPASTLDPKVPGWLSAVIARALRPDPGERFPTAAALASALREGLESGVTPAGAPPATQAPPGPVASPAAGRVSDLAPAFERVSSAAPAPGPTPGAAPRVRVSWRRFVVFLVVVTGVSVAAAAWLRSPAAGARPLPVVAVLPLVDASGGSDPSNLGIGLADTLVTNLATVPGLVVIARGATLRHADRRGDIRTLARDLGANYVVDGSVQRQQAHVRLALNLVRADGSVAWGSHFDGSADELFEVQARAAAAVAGALVPGEPRSAGWQPAAAARQAESSAQPARIPVDALESYAEGRRLLERSDVAGNAERAADAFARAVAIEPGFALAHAGLADASWARYSRSGDRTWLERAEAAANRARALDPGQADVQVTLATIYQGSGRPEDALDALGIAVKLQPRHDEAHRRLGDTLARLNRVQDALAAYDRAIALRPLYWRHYYARGAVLLRAQRYDEAIASFQRVVQLLPDSAIGHQALGAAYQMTGHLSEAASHAERAAALGPSASALSNLGVLYHWQGRFTEAIAQYERALGVVPTDPISYRNIGDARLRLGQPDQARLAYERAVALARARVDANPRDTEWQANLAVFEAKAGMRDAALTRSAETMRAAPDAADVVYARAVVLALAGRPREARTALDRAFALGYSRQLARRDDDLAAVLGEPPAPAPVPR